MDMCTYFDYNNYIVFMGTHTKIGIPHKKDGTNEVDIAGSGF